jgi:hypothetical protein
VSDLGLRDSCMINSIMGAKTWWKVLKNPEALWAHLWKKKYTPDIEESKLI